MSDLCDGIETVNESASSLSRNVDYVSQRNQYMVYTSKRKIKRNLEAAHDLIEANPDYLFEEEHTFLKRFISTFHESEHHGGYNVENQEYLSLFESALEAIEARMASEREKLIRDVGGDIGLKVQHMFYQIEQVLGRIIEELNHNWSDLIRGQKDLDSDIEEFNGLLQYLMRAYAYEHQLLDGEDLNESIVTDQIVQLSQQWAQIDGDIRSYA